MKEQDKDDIKGERNTERKQKSVEVEKGWTTLSDGQSLEIDKHS